MSVPPKIEYDSKLKQPQKLKEGKSLSLPVTVSGEPNPEIKWFRNDEPITGPSVEVKDTATSVKVKSVTAADSGTYKVVAENPVGSDSAEFTVNVKGKCYFMLAL